MYEGEREIWQYRAARRVGCRAERSSPSLDPWQSHAAWNVAEPAWGTGIYSRSPHAKGKKRGEPGATAAGGFSAAGVAAGKGIKGTDWKR